MSSDDILITGAPGKCRHPLVQELPPPVRRSGSLPWNLAWVGAALSGDDHLEVVRFDFIDPVTWSAIFAGAERMFLLRPPQLLRVGRDLLSALEPPQPGSGTWSCSPSRAERNRLVAHRVVEDHLGASPMAWASLRASFLLQNRSTTHAPRSASALWLPAGKGRTAFVEARDVAARAHTVRRREGTACILTGHGLHPDRPGRAHRRRPAAHWPLARDLGSFTPDHASPGRQPPWPLPERLAWIDAAHRQGSGLGQVLIPELPAREQGQKLPSSRAIRPSRRPGLPRQLAWNWLRKEWP